MNFYFLSIFVKKYKKLTSSDDGTVEVPLHHHAGVPHGSDLGLEMGSLPLVDVHVPQTRHNRRGRIPV